MKKALLLVLGIVAVCFLIANADYLASFLATLQTGALVPLVVACALMLARHLVQAASYDAAFEAVGHKTGFWHNVVLIFSLVFINTFCLFSGATGVAFIIDDAHRRGCDAGQSTSGAILSQIGYFAAILVISVIGFVTMLVSGSMNTLFLVGGLALAAVLAVLSSMFVAGYRKPRILFRLFLGLESLINKALGLLKRHLKPGWGRKTAGSFISSASILAKNPQGTLVTVAYASFSAILNMACLVAIGYAFGFDHVTALVAAFAVAAISVNALTYFGWCAAFDDDFRDSVRVYAASPAYGQGVGDTCALIERALDERLDAENVSVSVLAHGVSAGHTSFSATFEYMPTLFGLGLKSEVMGVALPKLSHTEELVVDCYKPGVLL